MNGESPIFSSRESDLGCRGRERERKRERKKERKKERRET
jgi:hypothetical protein